MAYDNLRVSREVAPVRLQVVERLRDAIVSMRFKPGDRLRERELCELTGVSRTSVREALRQLEAEGLVEVIANVGPIVTVISVEDVREIYLLRSVLEGLAGELFTRQATDEQIAELKDVTLRLGALVDRGEVHKMIALKDEFYEILLSGAGSVLVERTLASLRARVTVLRATTLSQADRPEDTYRELQQIIQAIEAKDPAGAEAACRAHVKNAAKVAISAWEAVRAASDKATATIGTTPNTPPVQSAHY